MKACLSEKSVSVGPPSSCDVLYYYESLQTATGRHRDAFSAGELHKYYTTGENPFAQNQYAQIKGTDVIIFTMGNTDMEMKLSFPETKADALDTPDYQQPSPLRIPLIPGTLLVYSPLDDLFFCHEVSFPPGQPSSPSAYRVAFVFRWLNESAERTYNLDPAFQGRHMPGAV